MGTTSSPSTPIEALRGARSATCSTARFSRHVNLVAAEHRVDAPAQTRLLGQCEQQADRLVGHAVLGIVEVQAGGLDDEPFTALWILAEQSSQVAAVDLVVMRL